MILTRRLAPSGATLRNGLFALWLAVSAPAATATIATRISAIAPRASTAAAKAACIAVSTPALTLVLTLPGEGVGANISKRGLHGIGLGACGRLVAAWATVVATSLALRTTGTGRSKARCGTGI